MDHLSPARRSWNMSRIKAKNTSPERAVRACLKSLRYKFSQHVTGLPGRPDFVLPRRRIAIFVHGCFWHRHPRCQFAYTPKTHLQFWENKFGENVARDRQVIPRLRKLGWRAGVLWECQVRDEGELRSRLLRLVIKLSKPCGYRKARERSRTE